MRAGAFLRGMSRAFGWSRPVGDPAAGARPHGAGEGSTQSDANLWRETLDMLPQGIVLLDPAGRYIFWNQRYADIYSGSADLFKVGVRLEDTLRIGIARGEYPEAAGREEAWLGERMERMRNPAGKIEQKLADGRWILIGERRTSDGGFIALRVDITDIKSREESFRLLFDANPVPMFAVGAADKCILAVNDSALRHYGFSRAAMMGGPFHRVEWLGAKDRADPDWSSKEAQSWTSTHRTASEAVIDVTLAAAWPDPVKVAVNLSPKQFRYGALLATVQAALQKSGLPACRLELEITEAMLLERTDLVQSTLHALRALGVRISMDDFGTGYSSLSYLRSFPFDKIKIDRSFVQEMATSADAAAIVRAIVTLGASLGIQVTAEGIETAEAAELLAEQGCTEGQGFFFSRPRPRSEADALVGGTGGRSATGPTPLLARAG
jgi:EAL domain-containing protein (putative c-di-GMP-specific phosphodiesterase class I)/PAS domain-containing protein